MKHTQKIRGQNKNPPKINFIQLKPFILIKYKNFKQAEVYLLFTTKNEVNSDNNNKNNNKHRQYLDEKINAKRKSNSELGKENR